MWESKTSSLNDGRIEKALSGFYYVSAGGRVLQCRARGKFRREGTSPLVGDRVSVRDLGGGEGLVEAIAPRKNEFSRPAAANIDQLVIIASAAIPVTDPYLIDRIAAIAALKSAQVLVVLNKCDLDPAEELYGIYSGSAIPVLRVSAATGEGMDALRRAIAGKLNVFTGNSGVGKSSILNTLSPDFHLPVGEVSKALGRGRFSAPHPPYGAVLLRGGHLCHRHPGLFLLRYGGAQLGAQGAFRGVLPGVCPLSGPVPVRGLRPCEGEGLRRSGGGEGGEDPPKPPRRLCPAL